MIEGAEVQLQLDDATVRLNITGGAESNMTLQELIEWRRREERLIHGQDPDSIQDEPGESTSHSADSPPLSGMHRLSGTNRLSG